MSADDTAGVMARSAFERHGHSRGRLCPTISLCRTTSQRNIPMLLGRILVALAVEHFEGVDDAAAGVARLDYGVHVAALGGDVRVREEVAEFVRLQFLDRCGGFVAGEA